MGRYAESDPIGLEGGVRTYGYVFANSLTLTDIRGLQSSPGIRDQINPNGVNYIDYTKYFETRFRSTIYGARALFSFRINKKICKKFSFSDGNFTIPGLDDGADDIDINPDMSRFGDEPQGVYERNVMIGHFQLKTKAVNVEWKGLPNACGRCFIWSGEMYVLENTGGNRMQRVFAERDVIMGKWRISGGGCCGKN